MIVLKMYVITTPGSTSLSCLAMFRGTAARRREVMDMDEPGEPEDMERIIGG